MRRSAIAAASKDLLRGASPNLPLGASPPQPPDLSEAVKRWLDVRQLQQSQVPVTIVAKSKHFN
jgi:hypothetical protein